MNNVESILVGGSGQRDGMESPSNYRVVKLHLILAPGHPQLAALKNWHKAREINGISVENVSPLGADLGERPTLVGGKVEEKVLEEPLVEEKLFNTEDRCRHRHEPFRR